MKTPNIRLRPETASDMSFLRSLFASTRVDILLSNLPEQQKQELIETQFNAQYQSYHTNYQNSEFLIVERDGQPCGRLYLSRMPKETRVIDIAIVPEHRRQGIGSCLLRAIQTESKMNQVAVTLHAEKFGDMAEYYKRLGFEIEEEKEAHFFMRWSAKKSTLIT